MSKTRREIYVLGIDPSTVAKSTEDMINIMKELKTTRTAASDMIT